MWVVKAGQRHTQRGKEHTGGSQTAADSFGRRANGDEVRTSKQLGKESRKRKQAETTP
jgi:hypothetical protein